MTYQDVAMLRLYIVWGINKLTLLIILLRIIFNSFCDNIHTNSILNSWKTKLESVNGNFANF